LTRFISIFTIVVSLRGEERLVRQHDTSNEEVEEESDLEPEHGLNGDVLVKLRCPSIILEQQALVDPVEHHVEQSTEWVQYWQSRRIHQHDAKIGVVLCVDVVTLDLLASVRGFDIRLKKLLCVNINISIFFRLFP
jgi:hypothetical protein